MEFKHVIVMIIMLVQDINLIISRNESNTGYRDCKYGRSPGLKVDSTTKISDKDLPSPQEEFGSYKGSVWLMLISGYCVYVTVIMLTYFVL